MSGTKQGPDLALGYSNLLFGKFLDALCTVNSKCVWALKLIHIKYKSDFIAIDQLSIGIRADDVGRGRIILREGSYRVWSTVLEQTLM